MEAGTANKPREENRLKKEKNEAVKVVQGGAAGGIKKVGRGSKPGV